MSELREINDLPYADYNGRILNLDLVLPESPSGKLPVIIFVVGGGWRTGGKKGLRVGKFLGPDGFAVVTIEYRSSSEVIAPGNVYDCKAAVRWVRANAGTYGLNPDRIGVFGCSAGGHLVALLGATNGLKELEGNGGNEGFSSDVQAVCDFCGPTDLTRIAIPEIREKYSLLYDVTAEYLGGPVDERRELALLVSPLHHASQRTVPTLIVHGDADDVVPVEESTIYYETLKKLGVDVSLTVLPGDGHSWDWKITRAEVVAFFHRTLSA